MKINILTIGTRGYVQPYLGLGAGLAARGHDVAVLTLAEFEDAVEDTGLEHRPLRGDFIAVAQARGVEAPPSLEMMREYRRMAAETLEEEWAAAKDADLLVFNPAAWGGPHIAEKLDIPAFAAFPTPMYTPTRTFPSPFIPVGSLGPFNKVSHSLVIKSGPAAFRKPISHWRRNVLDLPKRGEGHSRCFTPSASTSSRVPRLARGRRCHRLLVPRQRSELAPAALTGGVHRRRRPARVHRFREHVHSPRRRRSRRSCSRLSVVPGSER